MNPQPFLETLERISQVCNLSAPVCLPTGAIRKGLIVTGCAIYVPRIRLIGSPSRSHLLGLSERFRSLLDRLERGLGTLPTKNLELFVFQFIGCDEELD
jgi:hypothetical protein